MSLFILFIVIGKHFLLDESPDKTQES